jgi:hypothetical protein
MCGYLFCELPGFFSVLVDNGLEQLFMELLGFDKSLSRQMGLVEVTGHLFGYGSVQIGEYIVPGGHGDGDMELDIAADGVFYIVGLRCCVPFVQQGLHLCDVFTGAEQGGFLGDLYLQQLSYFVEIGSGGPAEALG